MALFERFRAPFLHDLNDIGAAASGPRSAGEMLRQQREALGLELRDVAAVLRIKPDYLAALEAGRPDLLPGPTYASGFVRAYGQHLKLDGNEMLRRFRAESAALDTKPDLAFPMALGERSMPRRSMLLVALILALCGYGTWYFLATAERSHPERVAEVPDALMPTTAEPRAGSAPLLPAADTASESRTAAQAGGASLHPPTPNAEPARSVGSAVAVAAVPSDTPSPPPAAGSASATAVVPNGVVSPAAPAAPDPPPKPGSDDWRTHGAADAPGRVVIRATANTWMQIRQTGQPPLFTGVLKAGDSFRVPDRPGVTMRTGNAGGLEIMVDGQPAPPIGATGAVRNIALEPQSLVAGTARGR